MDGIPAMRANGNIYPARFVKLDPADNQAVLQAGAGAVCIGVSAEGLDSAPIPANTSGFAAVAGENITFFGPMRVCKLLLGATVSTERRLKPDADGKGTPVVGGNASYETYGAVALEAGSSGEKVTVLVMGPMSVAHPGAGSGFA